MAYSALGAMCIEESMERERVSTKDKDRKRGAKRRKTKRKL
jgi:hypothetical protein